MCVMSEQILDCLKRKRDICIKNIIPSQNTAFRWTPALRAKGFYYIDTDVLLKNIPLVKFIKNTREFIDDFIDIKFVS